MAGPRRLKLVGVVWFGAILLVCDAKAQELPASWRIRVSKMASDQLVDDYLIARYKVIAATAAREKDVGAQVSLDNQPVMITRANAEALSRIFEAQVVWYAQTISDRACPSLPEGFLLETEGECSSFGLRRGPVLVTQEGFDLTLWQNGFAHQGVVCDTAIAFEHNKSPEIRFMGKIEEDAISLKINAIGFAKDTTSSKCSIKLTPVEALGSEFGIAFYDRAVALLDQDEYERASSDLDRAIELNPNLAEAFYLRSQMESVSPDPRFLDGTLAVEDAKRACDLTDWKHWQCLAPLACAYAQAGEFDKAVQTMKKAHAVAPPDKKQLMSDALDKFRQKKPMRYALHISAPADPVAKPAWMSLPEKSGVSVEVVGEEKAYTGKFFQIKTRGLTVGSRYRLWMKGLVQDWHEVPDMGYIEANGMLALVREGAVVPMKLGLAGFQKGESISLVLVSEDQRSKVTLKFIPRPLAAYDSKSGYGLEAELLDAEGNLYLVTAKGFDGEQAVKWYTSQLSAGKEVLMGEMNLIPVDSVQTTFVVATAVYGKKGDIARLRFVGTKGEIGIALPWGDRLPGK